MLSTITTILEFIAVIILPCYVLYGILEVAAWIWFEYDFTPRLRHRLQELKDRVDE